MSKKVRIEAIETWYSGRHYRSRLESRWSIFFTEMRLPFKYEERGYYLDNGASYLPDFVLALPDGTRVELEIKPLEISDKEREKIEMLKDAWWDWEGHKPMWLIQGYPGLLAYSISMNYGHDATYTFAECRRCGGVCFTGETSWGNIGKHICNDHDRPPDPQGEKILAAYKYAMGYKFEHKIAYETEGAG